MPALRRVVWKKDLDEYVPLKRTQRQERILAGEFPPGHTASDNPNGRRFWWEDEIRGWQEWFSAYRAGETKFQFSQWQAQQAKPKDNN